MPIAIAILVAAAKAGGFLIGSIVHEVGKHFRVENKTARASCLLKGDEQLELRETLKVPSSNALVLSAPRSIVQSSSSSVLAILSNDSLESQQFDVLEKNLISLMTNLKLFADWYQARIIAMMQSAIRSLFIDTKGAISSFFGSANESVVKKEANTSISCLIKMNICGFLVKIIFILKEMARLLISCAKQNVSKLVGRLLLTKIRAKQPCLGLIRGRASVGDSILVEIGTSMLQFLTMPLTNVKQALAMLFDHSHNWSSLRHPFQLCGSKVSALLCLMLCVGISLIGWNIPFMLASSKLEEIRSQQSSSSHYYENIFDLEAGIFSAAEGKLEEIGLQQSSSHDYENIFNLEAGKFSPVTPRLTVLSNSLIWTEHTSNFFEDLYSVFTALQANVRHADFDPDLDNDPLSLKFWPDDDVSTAFNSQTNHHWNDDTSAVSTVVDWNIDPTHRFHSGAALESSLFISVLQQVPEDISSQGFAAEHFAMTVFKAFDGYVVSAMVDVDETFTPSLIAQVPRDRFALELLGHSPKRSVSDGDTSSMLIVFTEVDSPQELPVIQYPTGDGPADSPNASHLRLPLVSDRISTFAQALSIQYPSEDLDQRELSLDISSISIALRNSEQFAAALLHLRIAFSLLKSTRPHNLWELRQLALVLLMFVYCNSVSDWNTNEPDHALASEMSPGTDSEEAPEAKVTFVDEENGEEEALLPITNSKSLRRGSTALRSELGRHWKSPSKRRRRRSCHTRSKPKYYEPE